MNLPNSDIFDQTGEKLLNPYLNRYKSSIKLIVHFKLRFICRVFLMVLTDNQYLNLMGPDRKLNPKCSLLTCFFLKIFVIC